MNYKYIKQLAHPSNYGGARDRSQIKYIVIHYTGNDGDKAANNAKYFQSANRNASAHYFVDSNNVYQSVCDLSIAWSVGGAKYTNCKETGGGAFYGKCTNANSISIELCDDIKDGKVSANSKTLNNAAILCSELMSKYNIPIERVIRHFDVTGKNCPAYFVDSKAWKKFLDLIAKTKDGLVTQDAERTEMEAPKSKKYRVTAPDGLNVRGGAGTGHKKLFALACGDRFEYLDRSGDWIRGKDNAGRTGYAYAKWLEIEK